MVIPKGKLLIYILIALGAIVVLAFGFDNTKKPLVIGFHDPEGTFLNEKRITLTSDYFAWNKDLTVISDELKTAEASNRSFLVTLEPWPKPLGFKYDSNDQLLQAIVAGEYDETIQGICMILAPSKVPVYIRWGHEMELENSRYPWSHATPELYINAYRHFVTTCKKYSHTFKYVWSPAGEQGLEKYWPGAAYVNIIGLSIYSFDEYDLKRVGHKRSFREVFFSRYNRVKVYGKPVLIAEMGATGTDSYKMEWIGWMMKDIPNYKQLMGVVYLNTQDPQAIWEPGLSNPDWRLPLRVTSLLFKE